jgi:hypothetical protein
MIKISGHIVFIGNIIVILIFLYFMAIEDNSANIRESILILLILIFSISGIFYTIKTRFWTDKPSIIEDLEKENEIIKRKIEKMELLKKLNEYEQK